MALTYRNTQTGRVAEVLEVPEVEKAQGPKAAIHAQRTIHKMDVSKRWERLSDPDEIRKAQDAWEAKLAASRPRRQVSPTPVYVVNQAEEKPDGKPSQADPKAEWVEYAREQGIDDAEELTKAELMERLGG